jgi:hypothetical protein
MMLRARWRIVLELARARGWWVALGIAARWLISREYLVLARPLLPPFPELPLIAGVEWRELAEADLPALLALNPGLTLTEVRRRQGEGQRCLLGWSGNRPVHYRWDARQTTYLPYLGRPFRLLAGDWFVEEVFTDPAFRERGITWASVVLTLSRAHQDGATRFLSLVPWWNRPSLRAAEKTGMEVVGRIGFWTVGFSRRYFSSGAVRFDRDGAAYLASGRSDEFARPALDRERG